MSVLEALDRALWRLPRCVRRAIASPVIVLGATLAGAHAGREELLRIWRDTMAYVNERPSESEH
jgi:hypothetical protein